MIPYPGTYILSIINHKESYQLTDDISLEINKSFENNLRERNPQLGLVEAVNEDDNPYDLVAGDIVAVNHFTFYGDIGADKSFNLQEHFEYEGKKYFKVLCRQIFFKYNNKIAEPLGDFILCEKIVEEKSPSGIILQATPEINRVKVKYGEWEGKEVLVLDNAMYLITLDKTDYYKVKKDEVVAIVENDEITPVGKNMVIEYLPEKVHPFLDLSLVKKDNNLRAKVIKNSTKAEKTLIKWNMEGNANEGDEVQVWRNQGVVHGKYRVVDPEMILWKYEKA